MFKVAVGTNAGWMFFSGADEDMTFSFVRDEDAAYRFDSEEFARQCSSVLRAEGYFTRIHKI